MIKAEHWPYGPPSAHEDFCNLHRGGAFCDCDASSATCSACEREVCMESCPKNGIRANYKNAQEKP